MSQQPQEGIVDRIIDWWKRLFGPASAGDRSAKTGTQDAGSGVQNRNDPDDAGDVAVTGTPPGARTRTEASAGGADRADQEMDDVSAEGEGMATRSGGPVASSNQDSSTNRSASASQDAGDGSAVPWSGSEEATPATGEGEDFTDTDTDTDTGDVTSRAQNVASTRSTDEAMSESAADRSGDTTTSAFDAAQAGRAAAGPAASSAGAAAGEASARTSGAAEELHVEAETLHQNSEDIGHSGLYMDAQDDPASTTMDSAAERESSEWVDDSSDASAAPASEDNTTLAAVDTTAADGSSAFNDDPEGPVARDLDNPDEPKETGTDDSDGNDRGSSAADEQVDSFARDSPQQDENNWGQGSIDQPGSGRSADEVGKGGRDRDGGPVPDGDSSTSVSPAPAATPEPAEADEIDVESTPGNAGADKVGAASLSNRETESVTFESSDEAAISEPGAPTANAVSSGGQDGMDAGSGQDRTTISAPSGTTGGGDSGADLEHDAALAASSAPDTTSRQAAGRSSSGSGRSTPEGAVAGDGTHACPDGFPIKGNANSHIYHQPGESSYEATVAEWCFRDEASAKAAGYRARKR